MILIIIPRNDASHNKTPAGRNIFQPMFAIMGLIYVIKYLCSCIINNIPIAIDKDPKKKNFSQLFIKKVICLSPYFVNVVPQRLHSNKPSRSLMILSDNLV